MNIEIGQNQIKEHFWMKNIKKCDTKYVTVLNLQIKDNVSFVRSRNRGKYGNKIYLKTAKLYADWIQMAHVASNKTSRKHGNETSGFIRGGVEIKTFAVSCV